MNPNAEGSRSAAELATMVLRTLMLGNEIWGLRSASVISDLAVSLHTSEDRLRRVLRALVRERLVVWNRANDTVRLTTAGARTRATRGQHDRRDSRRLPPRVVFRSTKWH